MATGGLLVVGLTVASQSCLSSRLLSPIPSFFSCVCLRSFSVACSVPALRVGPLGSRQL